jgi:basic membrane protein A and related proteins
MKPYAATAAALLVGALLTASGTAGMTSGPRVGFVAYPGTQPTPRTLDGLVLFGFVRAEKELPIRGTVRYIAPTRGPGDVLSSFARQDYDLVVAPLFDATPVGKVSRRFPSVHFLVVDAQPGSFAPRRHAKNIHRAVFRAEQAGYLAGYLSALMAQRRHGHLISAVGGFRFYGVTRWIVGYRAGAQKADPRITFRVDYTGDFANPTKCRRVALSQIAAGSKVVFDVAGACGFGALRAAKEKGIWGVGVDTDQSFLGRHILTSAVMRLDRGVFDSVHRLVRGTLRPGATTVYDVPNGGVQLGRNSPKVPRPFVRRVERIRRQIADGTIVVPRPKG